MKLQTQNRVGRRYLSERHQQKATLGISTSRKEYGIGQIPRSHLPSWGSTTEILMRKARLAPRRFCFGITASDQAAIDLTQSRCARVKVLAIKVLSVGIVLSG